MDETPEIGKEIEDEAVVHNFQLEVARVFPQYSEVDRTGFDAYEKVKDVNGRGKILRFDTSETRSETSPNIRFIFRESGFVVNYKNSPEPDSPFTHRNKDDSIYGPNEQRWKLDEIDLALEAAKIHMEGVDTFSPQFRDQPVRWSEEEQRFVTMGERLDDYKNFQAKTTSFKKQVAEEWERKAHYQTVWNLLAADPVKAQELAALRISKEQKYAVRGIEYSPVEMEEHMSAGDPVWVRAVIQELNRIDAQEFLFRIRNML